MGLFYTHSNAVFCLLFFLAFLRALNKGNFLGSDIQNVCAASSLKSTHHNSDMAIVAFTSDCLDNQGAFMSKKRTPCSASFEGGFVLLIFVYLILISVFSLPESKQQLKHFFEWFEIHGALAPSHLIMVNLLLILFFCRGL
jgi:hypothetical protein